ncbi:hypothetical protein ACWD4N_31680 [Streptomyces sp. NPDC002586]
MAQLAVRRGRRYSRGGEPVRGERFLTVTTATTAPAGLREAET